MKRDLFCRLCDLELMDFYMDGLDFPSCPCGGRMETLFATAPVIDAWGGPQYDPALDIYFASKSERRAYMKGRNLMECGDPVHGARNQDGLNLGKSYSFGGQTRRERTDYAETRKERTLIRNGRVVRG